jgi:phage terminase small subunit
MGRRAQSPELKEARGNPGKRPIKKVATVVAHIKLQRPAWLTDAAKKVWDQLQGSLHFLRETDSNVFGRYCVYLTDWVTATKAIKTSGGAVYTTSSQHVQDMFGSKA